MPSTRLTKRPKSLSRKVFVIGSVDPRLEIPNDALIAGMQSAERHIRTRKKLPRYTQLDDMMEALAA